MNRYAVRGIRFVAAAAAAVTALLAVRSTQLQAQYEKMYLENANYRVQTGMYAMSRIDTARIVMLGTSLTYNAAWNELLNRPRIVNRGIYGDILPGFLHRMPFVWRLHPKICFIEGGVNDVSANYTAEDIFRSYVHVIDTLRSYRILPVIQSTLFVGSAWPDAAGKNAEIRKLNILLREYARQYSIPFLDVNALVSTAGILRPEYTYDGIHLNADGYARWIPLVEAVLKSNGL